MAKATTMMVTGLVLIGAAGAGGYWYGSQRYASANVSLSQEAQAAQRRLERVGNLNHLLSSTSETSGSPTRTCATPLRHLPRSMSARLESMSPPSMRCAMRL